MQRCWSSPLFQATCIINGTLSPLFVYQTSRAVRNISDSDMSDNLHPRSCNFAHPPCAGVHVPSPSPTRATHRHYVHVQLWIKIRWNKDGRIRFRLRNILPVTGLPFMHYGLEVNRNCSNLSHDDSDPSAFKDRRFAHKGKGENFTILSGS